MEKLLWLIECIKTGLWIFMLGVSHKTMLHGWVGSWCSQWSNGDINWEQSVSYHVGDSHHTQNVQISNGTGEKKSKNVSFMLQKTKQKQRGILVIPIEYQLELKRKKRERERERESSQVPGSLKQGCEVPCNIQETWLNSGLCSHVSTLLGKFRTSYSFIRGSNWEPGPSIIWWWFIPQQGNWRLLTRTYYKNLNCWRTFPVLTRDLNYAHEKCSMSLWCVFLNSARKSTPSYLGPSASVWSHLCLVLWACCQVNASPLRILFLRNWVRAPLVPTLRHAHVGWLGHWLCEAGLIVGSSRASG